MAVKNIVDNMTALEVARRTGGETLTIIETMAMQNTLLQEMPAMQANDGAVHTGILRRSYPGGEHRVYNQGVRTASSQTDTFHEYIADLEAFSDVDQGMAVHSGNPAKVYSDEATAFISGMGIDQAVDIIYGNRGHDPAEINGFATRLNKIDGIHCVDAGLGGTGNNLTSVYLVAAGPLACHLIYPKGSATVGVQREDLGINRIADPNDSTRTYMAHTDHFKAEYGVCVEHPDSLIRIANIPANLTATQRETLIEKILEMQMNLTTGIVNTILFCNKSMAYQIERAAREKQYVVFAESDPWGKPVSSINGLRVRRMDVILNTEEQVL
jgi:hypothetical protein